MEIKVTQECSFCKATTYDISDMSELILDGEHYTICPACAYYMFERLHEHKDALDNQIKASLKQGLESGAGNRLALDL